MLTSFREEGLTEDATLSDSFRNAVKISIYKNWKKNASSTFQAFLRIAVDTLENEPSGKKETAKPIFLFYR
jgi:hypothetical protein